MQKIIFRIFLIIIVPSLFLILLNGCASVPMASLEEDSIAKKYQVSNDKSMIYLFRNENFGGALPLTVSIDEQIAGQTAPYTYFVWEVIPGEHLIKSFAEDVSSLLLVAQPGKAHFVRQEVKMGMWMARSQLYEVSEQDGRDAVNECKMAKSNITRIDKALRKDDANEIEKMRLQLEIKKIELEQQKLKSPGNVQNSPVDAPIAK